MAEIITPFIPPDFLQNQSVEDIHKRMMQTFPADIDRSEGGFPWDFTRPTANEKAELVGYALTNTIRAIFAQWCEDYLLDFHADRNGMVRKPAEYARAILTITGEEGTEIPAGFVVSTAATYNRPSVSFTFDTDIVLGAGETRAAITAAEAGAASNVGAHTIIIVDAPIKGLKTIDNLDPATGGIDRESSDALRQRVLEHERSQGVSYVGSNADYRRWALEVPGVGSVQVQGGEEGDNTVKLILTGSDGKPASEEVQQAVHDHIMRPDDRSQRLAGVNDLLIITPATALPITVSAKLVLDGTATIESITEELRLRLAAYYADSDEKTIVRYSHIGSEIISCAGVTDYSALQINGGVDNILVAVGEIPVTESADITLTEEASA